MIWNPPRPKFRTLSTNDDIDLEELMLFCLITVLNIQKSFLMCVNIGRIYSFPSTNDLKTCSTRNANVSFSTNYLINKLSCIGSSPVRLHCVYYYFLKKRKKFVYRVWEFNPRNNQRVSLVLLIGTFSKQARTHSELHSFKWKLRILF